MGLSIINSRREKWISDLLDLGSIQTPALVIDTHEVDSMLDLFRFHLPEAKLFYAVKANNSRSLLQHLAGQGVNFDVSSASEIIKLRSLGVPPTRLILSNPIKSVETINTFFDNKLSLAVIDNSYDLEMLQSARLARRIKKDTCGIFVRIRISTTDIQIDLNQKFGATEDEAVELLFAAKQAGFSPRGIQFHVGTQSWNANNYRIGVLSALRVIDLAESRYGIKCDSVNIGGGFPDPVLARECGGLQQFFEQLRVALNPLLERGLNIIAEPGRIMSSSACSAVCTIIGTSVRNGTPWLYLDDGAYGLFSGKFFDHKDYHFRVVAQERKKAKTSRFVPYVVAGPTCDSLDVVCHTTMLPPDLKIGDVVCSHNMGAYSMVTASAFNGFGKIHVYCASSKEHARSQEKIRVLPVLRVANQR